MKVVISLSLVAAGCSTAASAAWPPDQATVEKAIVRSPAYQCIVKWGATPHCFIEKPRSTPARCVVYLGTVQDDTISRVATLGFRPDGSIVRLVTKPDNEEEWAFEAGPP